MLPGYLHHMLEYIMYGLCAGICGQRMVCQAWLRGPNRDPLLSPTLGCASCATAWLPCQYLLTFIKRTSSLSI